MILLDEETQKELRKEYYHSRLFCTLFDALSYLQQLYGELPPAQVWHEVVEFCAQRLKGVEMLEYEVSDLYNCLLNRYLTFETPAGETIMRSENQAAYTTVCVLTCVCFRLVSEPDEAATVHSEKAVVRLLKRIGRHPVHAFLYKEQRIQEEYLEREGHLIERTPWLQMCDLPKPEPLDPSQRLSAEEERQLNGLFQKLFQQISLDNLRQWVAQCEKTIIFTSRIERIAYLVAASQNGWLIDQDDPNISSWVKLMNAILGPDKSMQVSEVNRKWKDLRFESFTHARSLWSQQYVFKSDNITQKFFRKLQKDVLKITEIKQI